MKAISLWQPWGSLWLTPRKIHETRHWKIQVPENGCWLAVHAAKRFIKDHPPEMADILRAEFGSLWYRTLPTGAIIGAVFIEGCYRTEDIVDAALGYGGDQARAAADDLICGNFDKGRFGWRRREYRVFDRSIAYRGAQGLFTVPDHLLVEAMAA